MFWTWSLRRASDSPPPPPPAEPGPPRARAFASCSLWTLACSSRTFFSSLSTAICLSRSSFLSFISLAATSLVAEEFTAASRSAWTFTFASFSSATSCLILASSADLAFSLSASSLATFFRAASTILAFSSTCFEDAAASLRAAISLSACLPASRRFRSSCIVLLDISSFSTIWDASLSLVLMSRSLWVSRLSISFMRLSTVGSLRPPAASLSFASLLSFAFWAARLSRDAFTSSRDLDRPSRCRAPSMAWESLWRSLAASASAAFRAAWALSIRAFHLLASSVLRPLRLALLASSIP
mmetsp:Transcript_2956/g.5655  ORF Transcript_2956/g.5655 Transcript_2956/m.5655 type:complete len:298 (-) Transcript_2956:382-1275(-)